MKQTLITLLLLGGVSLGATISTSTLVDNIQAGLTLQNYQVGDSFSITFTLEEVWDGQNWAGILGLGTSFGGTTDEQLRVETTTSGLSSALVGLAVDGTALGSTTAGYWTTGSRVWDASSSTLALTLEAPANVWMQFSSTASTGSTAKADNASNMVGAAITLSYDHVTSTSTIKVVNASDVTCNLVIEDTPVWDATKIANSGWQGATWGESISINVTPAVPEPATATLSLLALAGLAARRRRK